MFAPALSIALAAAPASHAFNVHDLIAMDRISDLAVSPDGNSIAFTVSSLMYDDNKRQKDVWVVGSEGRGLRQLTRDLGVDTNARWAPDGKSLFFLSTRSGSSQVWRLSLDGGDPEPVTRLPLDVTAFSVFPDGKRLLLAIDVFPDSNIEGTAKRDDEEKKSKTHVRAYDKLLFRHWDEWEDGKVSHLFAFTLGAPGMPVDLTAGMDADIPVKPFGGAESFSISPDGSEVAFATQLYTHDAAWSTDLNVYLVPSNGKAPPRSITSENKATDESPLYSPDGQTIAYLAMKRPQFESDRRVVMLYDRKTQKSRALTEAWDRSPEEIEFAPDGKTIYATADNLGNGALFAIDVASGAVKPLVEKGHVTEPRADGSRVVFSRDSLKGPAELFSVARAGGNPEPLTQLNARHLEGVQFGEYEQFNFKGAHGDTVYGYLIKPAGFRPGQKYPVALVIHGGPQGSFGDLFHYRWNGQIYAGAGYATLMIDFHGSTGYGQAFTDAISRDYGGAPYEDLMKGLDFALARYNFLDGNRVAALGASYGGFMINWIAGHTDRFKALVCHDGIFDSRGGYFETEELWFDEWDQGGTPWDNPENFERFNPLDYVKNWKTPMLFIHGSLDYRLPETQGMAAFTAAQRRGVPSRFLSFPDENHWVLKPQNSVRWHKEVLAWLDQWVNGVAPKKNAAASGAMP